MKIKDGFVMQDVAGSTMVLSATGELNIMITLNGTGKFLWEHLEQEITRQGLIDALLAEYDVDPETAGRCVDRFVSELEKNDLLA